MTHIHEPLPTELPDEAAELAYAQAQAETNAGVARATGVLALGNIASRVLGLAREIVLSNLFGASSAVSAVKVATNIPLAFYDLLIGGHVNSAIIPILSEIASRDGQRALWQLVSILISAVTVMLAVLVLVLELLAPQIVSVAGGAEFVELAASLLRITAPALVFMALFAVLSATLYALREFTWPAFAGAAFNGTVVIITFVFAGQYGVSAFALGWLVGALVQLLLQLPGLHDARLHFTLNWKHPALRQIMVLYAPVMFSLVMDTLVIRTFSYNLASQTGEASIGYMGWATTLIQFPHGLVATAISVAILPTLSRQATNNDDSGRSFKETLGSGLRLVITLIVPAAVGLFIMAIPIIALLFEHGKFTAQDTIMTALTLRLYLLGLPFAAVDLLLVYAFYARQDTFTPALIGLVSMLVYMVVAVMLMPTCGLFSLMLADSAKHVVHMLLSAYFLTRKMNGFGQQRVLLTLGKAMIAALGMGIVAALAEPVIEGLFPAAELLGEIALVSLTGSLSVLIFVLLAFALRLDELRWILGLIRSKVGR